MKNAKIILAVCAFILGIGSAYITNGNNIFTYPGYRSPSSSGASCVAYSNIPDDCLTSNVGAQCTVSISGVTNYLFASKSGNVCINPVKRP